MSLQNKNLITKNQKSVASESVELNSMGENLEKVPSKLDLTNKLPSQIRLNHRGGRGENTTDPV